MINLLQFEKTWTDRVPGDACYGFIPLCLQGKIIMKVRQGIKSRGGLPQRDVSNRHFKKKCKKDVFVVTLALQG